MQLPVDVALFTGRFDLKKGREWLPRHCDEGVQLAEDLFIGPLGELVEPILDACEFRGANWRPAYRQHGSLYAFWHLDPRGRHWDPGHRLGTCLQLSRIARPTTHALRYSARVTDQRGDVAIRPSEIAGFGAYAYILNPDDDGLWDEDVEALRELLDVFDPDILPNRIKNALWLFENVVWNKYMNVRWSLLSTALEAIVHTDDRARKGGWKSTEQFVNRLFRLRGFVGELRWSEQDLADIYEIRSSFAHGQGGLINALRGEPRRLYELLEGGFRSILAAAIRNPLFAAEFASESSIRCLLGPP